MAFQKVFKSTGISYLRVWIPSFLQNSYYDDIRPVDEGHEREGIDKELIKKIAIIIGVLFVVIAACVALMYVL